jgi:hypothetical protein
MNQEIARFEKTTPIVDGEQKPLDYLSWIKQSNLDITLASKYKSQYTAYVSDWYTSSTKATAATKDITNTRYKTFLEEVDIHNATSEENRFISNINYDNKEDLETVIPHLAKSIKESITSYHNVREDVKYQKIKYSISGTRYGLDKIIRNIIYNALRSPGVQEKYKLVFEKFPVKYIVNQLVINIEEYYDLAQDYYDNDKITSKSTLREKFQDQSFPRKLITDVASALTSLDSQETVLSNDSAVQVITSDLVPLIVSDAIIKIDPEYTIPDYINYSITDNSNTNYQIINSLVYDDIGTDLYSLITDAAGEYELKKISSKKNNHNLLNIYYPTQNYIPSTKYNATDRDIGRLFRPSNVALQRYYSHDITPLILKDKLKPSTTYILPDINLYGNITNNTDKGLDLPITHAVATDWVKSDRTNYARTGYINNSKNHNKFDGYISTNESQNQLERGPARSTDSYDFWGGDEDDIWNHSDIYPVTNIYDYDYDSKTLNMLPIESIQELVDSRHKSVVKYSTDIYGNEWFLIKTTDQVDRATKDVSDLTPSEESGIFKCTTVGGIGFTFDAGADTLTLDGGSLDGTTYHTTEIMTDWLLAINNVECDEEGIIRTTYNCNTLDGAFFITRDYRYNHDAEVFDTSLSTTLTADGRSFTASFPCDNSYSPITPGESHDIDDRLIPIALGPENYASVLVPSTTALDYSNNIYDKKTVTDGELWVRNSTTSKLTKYRNDVKDFDIYYDIIYLLDATGNTFYRVDNDWTESQTSLVLI